MKPHDTILITAALMEELLRVCVEALPGQAYGLVGGEDTYHPKSIYPCSSNLRNTPDWKPLFESLGDFYRNPDRGFVISPEEYLTVTGKMGERGERFIGVFHSHRWHGPHPTKADLALHDESDVLSYIVSVVDPKHPVLEVFRLFETRYEKTPFRIVD